MTKRILSALLAAVLSLGVLVSCAGGDEGKTDDTTPAARDLSLTGHCDIMIVTAVEIVADMLAERE